MLDEQACTIAEVQAKPHAILATSYDESRLVGCHQIDLAEHRMSANGAAPAGQHSRPTTAQAALGNARGRIAHGMAKKGGEADIRDRLAQRLPFMKTSSSTTVPHARC